MTGRSGQNAGEGRWVKQNSIVEATDYALVVNSLQARARTRDSSPQGESPPDGVQEEVQGTFGNISSEDHPRNESDCLAARHLNIPQPS